MPNFLFAQLQLSGIGLAGGGSFSEFQYGEQVKSVEGFDNGTKAGGTAGLRMDFDILQGSEVLKFSPEVFIIQNGSKEFYKDFSVLQKDIIDRKISLSYLGLYLPLTLYVPIGEEADKNYNGLLLQGRLFMDYIVGEPHIVNNLNSNEEPVKFSQSGDKFDFGYAIEGGFVKNGAKFTIGYNWGVKNIRFANAVGALNSNSYQLNNKGLTLQIGGIFKLN